MEEEHERNRWEKVINYFLEGKEYEDDSVRQKVEDLVKLIRGDAEFDSEQIGKNLFDNKNYFSFNDADKLEQDLKKFWYDLELKIAHNKMIDENDDWFEEKVFEVGYDPTAKDVEHVLSKKIHTREEIL